MARDLSTMLSTMQNAGHYPMLTRKGNVTKLRHKAKGKMRTVKSPRKTGRRGVAVRY